MLNVNKNVCMRDENYVVVWKCADYNVKSFREGEHHDSVA